MRRAQPIGQILAGVVKSLGLAKRLDEQRAIVEWRDIVGGRIAEHARATRVTGGRLFVEVDSSVWAQELSLMRRTIVREINGRVGREAIQHVHFFLGGASVDGASCHSDEEDQHNGQG
jgi:predicted nucleic acid-binding Zn ribbon protein